jgi:hypothetical protein
LVYFIAELYTNPLSVFMVPEQRWVFMSVGGVFVYSLVAFGGKGGAHVAFWFMAAYLLA